MKGDSERDAEQRFVREWRAWLDRPPRQPPRAAAARVSAALGNRRRGFRPAWSVATAVASLVLVASVALFLSRDRPRPAVTPNTASVPSADSLKPGEVLIWLDADTPLYMHFQSPGVEGVN